MLALFKAQNQEKELKYKVSTEDWGGVEGGCGAVGVGLGLWVWAGAVGWGWGCGVGLGLGLS